MAEVTLRVGGRQYKLAAADGQEEALREAAAHLDARAAAIMGALGNVPEARLLLMAALQVTGELFAARRAQPAVAPAPAAAGLDLAPLLEAVERMEALAAMLAEPTP